MGYRTVHVLLTKALDRLGQGLNPEIALALRHYKELLATHVIGDPELDKLCDEIYRKHRRALDLIFERTSRPYQMLARAVHAWIAENADRVLPNRSQKAYVSFVPKAWLPFSHVVGQEGGKDRYSLSGLVKNGNKGARITIELYQGDEAYRKSVRSAAQSDAKSFPGFVKNAGSAF